jgi:hypothetical protein
MDRRDTFKSLLIGGLAGGFIVQGCVADAKEKKKTAATATADSGPYGRTEKEKAHDTKVMSEPFFTEHEMATVAVLCDLILPATATAGSATDAEVPEFISFIIRDITSHQLPIRGGIMWLDHQSIKSFDRYFTDSSVDQQKQLLDQIAWPDKSTPELEPGIKFFNRMRNLVLTGYYTTKIGIDDLGYIGNMPNVWDGVPQEVLDKHGLAYDEAWLAKCVDQEKRNDLAKWDENGNLIS